MINVQEYLATKGNVHYLINVDYDEAMSFDSFGNCQGEVSGKFAVFNSISRTEVNILSVIGDQISGICNVYYNGYEGTVSRSAFDVARDASKKLQVASYRIYRVKRDDLSPGIRQLLIPLKKDSAPVDSIFSQLGVKRYNKI